MGRFFSSFDEAWTFFVERREDLEDFFAAFPLDESLLLGWLLQPDARLLSAAEDVQRSFSHLDWITPLPASFFHVWLGGVAFSPRRPPADEIASVVEATERAWDDVEPFDLRYTRINCFHDAVVAEVEGDGPRRLLSRLVDAGISNARLGTFLPHLTLGVFDGPHDPAPLRDVLVQQRDTALGDQHVTGATLCVLHSSRTTILEPWEVVGSVAFG